MTPIDPSIDSVEIQPKVFFIDIDGTICKHSISSILGQSDMELLPGSLEKLHEWRLKGYHIILTTGRPVSREHTEGQLEKAGVPYDLLIMGLGGGKRILINDTKPDGAITAKAYSIKRDTGLGQIDE